MAQFPSFNHIKYPIECYLVYTRDTFFFLNTNPRVVYILRKKYGCLMICGSVHHLYVAELRPILRQKSGFFTKFASCILEVTAPFVRTCRDLKGKRVSDICVA
jgi:hypothetical protein